jgi:hypothetical protein
MHGGAAHRHGAGNLLVAAAAVRRQQYLGAQLRAARLPLLNIVVSSPHFDLAQFDMIKYIHLGLLSEPQVHRKARPVSGLHLRLVAHVPTTACRGRHATPLPRQPTLGSSDGPHHRASWLYPTPTRRRPKHRATCCPGKSAHPKMTENQPVKTLCTASLALVFGVDLRLPKRGRVLAFARWGIWTANIRGYSWSGTMRREKTSTRY